jgi:hypothetical protein
MGSTVPTHWLGGVETGFDDKLAAAFDDTGIRLACIMAAAAKAMAEWLDGGQACVCFVLLSLGLELG